MKKLVSILLLTIYLLSTTQLSELLKMPLLVQHYIEHKAENESLSIIGFLAIHYAHGSPKDADYDKDMQLPFKSITNTNTVSVSFFTPFLSFKHTPILYFKPNKILIAASSCNYSSAYLSNIWQPPKCMV